MLVTLNNVRLSFPSLFKMEHFNGDTNQSAYAKATFLYEEGSEAHKRLEKAAAEAAKAKWTNADELKKALAQIEKKGKGLIKDGSEQEYDGYEGMLYTASSNKDFLPTVVDKDRTVLTEASGRPYAGCYVNAKIDVWAQDNSYGKAINAKLLGVQFVKDGDAFVGSPPVKADDFDDVSDFGDDDDEGAEAFTG